MLLQAYCMRTIADITDFHIDFSIVVYNDRLQPWHAKLEIFKLFHYFSIFAFMCVESQTTKIMFVDTKYKNGKQILQQTDFANYNPISWPSSKWIYTGFFCDHK